MSKPQTPLSVKPLPAVSFNTMTGFCGYYTSQGISGEEIAAAITRETRRRENLIKEQMRDGIKPVFGDSDMYFIPPK